MSEELNQGLNQELSEEVQFEEGELATEQETDDGVSLG